MKQQARMTPTEREAARRYIRENYTFIALHAWYQQIGLPTALLKPIAPVEPPTEEGTAQDPT